MSEASVHPVRTVLAATASVVAVTLPVFLLGSHAAMVREDLGFDEAHLGFTMAYFFASSALTSIPAGRLSARFGAVRVLAAAVVLTASSLASVSLWATAWRHLAAGYAVAGVANGLAHTGANHLLAEGLRHGRKGLGLGIKQTAPMISSILAGLAVPLVGLHLGWRVGFAFGALVPGVLVFVARPPTTARKEPVARRGRRGRKALSRHRALLLLSIAGLLAAGPAGTLAVFLVETAMSRGIAAGPAGLLLSAGGALSLAVRLASGWFVDRTGAEPLLAMPVMLVLGSTGMLLLAFAGGYPLLLLATLMAFGAGWGWPALLALGTITAYERAPAEASGVVMAGVFAGGLVGPMVFGAIVTQASFTLAWVTMCAGLVMSATFLVLARRALARREDSPTAGHPGRACTLPDEARKDPGTF